MWAAKLKRAKIANEALAARRAALGIGVTPGQPWFALPPRMEIQGPITRSGPSGATSTVTSAASGTLPRRVTDGMGELNYVISGE